MSKLVHLEDDGPLREVFKIALNTFDRNVECIQFSNSDQMLEYVQQHQQNIDLYVFDIRVPGKLNGFESAELIRKWEISRPIIITSAFQKPMSPNFESLNLIWMPKPWHILDATNKILPLVYEQTV